MRINRIIVCMLGCCLLMATGYAEQVTVDGVGVDRDSAVRDAMRNAVERVVGTYVDSRTLVSEAVVSLDEIYTKSQGYVRDVEVLDEVGNGNAYRLTAKVDVDTNPDAALMSRLNMIMMLNAPRIAVIVKKNVEVSSNEYSYLDTSNKSDSFTETVMNGKLLEMGFNHIVEPEIVAKLKQSSAIATVLSGNGDIGACSDTYGIDYLVLGSSNVSANKIKLPNETGGYSESLLTTGRSILTVKVIKFDTGEVVATYTVDGQAVDNNDVFAQNKAIQVAAEKACIELENRFKKIAAQPFIGTKFVITAVDEAGAEEVVNMLKSCSGVQSVRVRERNGDMTVLDVESSQKPYVIIQDLKQKSHRGIFVEQISNGSVKLAIS